MKNGPLITIITNTLNRADLIHRCIESIKGQTYVNYEHIIADGNSSDNTSEVVMSYAENDPRIHYLKLDRAGSAYQMAEAVKLARGKYITFLDDDDEYLPEKLEKQVSLFETLPQEVGLVYCWMTYYDNEKPDKPIRIHKNTHKGFVGDVVVGEQPLSGTPTLMVRREVIDAIGGVFRDDIGIIGSDHEFVSRVTQKYSVDYVPESLVKVYINHGHNRLQTHGNGKAALEKAVIYHKYFLSEFADVYKRRPEQAAPHYFSLCRIYARLGDIKSFVENYKNLVKVSKKTKYILMPIYGLIYYLDTVGLSGFLKNVYRKYISRP